MGDNLIPWWKARRGTVEPEPDYSEPVQDSDPTESEILDYEDSHG